MVDIRIRGMQISSESDEIIQLFVKLKFIFKKHVNVMRVNVFNKRYAIPSLLQAFSLALAWIRPSLNTFLPVLHHALIISTNNLLHRQTVFILEPTFNYRP